MRAAPPPANVELIAAQVEAAWGLGRLRALNEDLAAATPDLVKAVLEEAARVAETILSPLNAVGDASGCSIRDGRVVTAPGHKEAWSLFVAGGWPSIEHPTSFGGQGLPLVVAAAAQELFDRACPAFGMLPVPQRSAVRLIAAHGSAGMQSEWLPRLISGEWGATICISEAEAGSDVGAVRTKAEPNGDGSWSITGEKTWISFGDHDLTPRIAHCLLARTPGAPSGAGGLSLFLVPDTLEDETGACTRNSIAVRRIEEKMGLHVSPTCALGFEAATGWLLGAECRGLAQMFVMIRNMRLAVGVQGLGIAAAAAETARAYAAERRQGRSRTGGRTIDSHPDVQRMLLDMAAGVDSLRGLVLSLAVLLDLTAHETDEAPRAASEALAQWLLPIVKTLGGETAFETASQAMQVLGGAGYTRDWPVEQYLRDSRVLTIFEGTTAIQGLDLLQRRLLQGERAGYNMFLGLARAAAIDCSDAQAGTALLEALSVFEGATNRIIAAGPGEDTDAGATAYLRLAGVLALGWVAARNIALHGDDPASRRLAATGRYYLTEIVPRSHTLAAAATRGAAPLAGFALMQAG